jgi:hypothetical protein
MAKKKNREKVHISNNWRPVTDIQGKPNSTAQLNTAIELGFHSYL